MEDALVYAEEKWRLYAKCRGITVTNSIINNNLEIIMFLSSGLAHRRLETRKITMPLKSLQDEDSNEENNESEDKDSNNYHTSSISKIAKSYIDSNKVEYSTKEV